GDARGGGGDRAEPRRARHRVPAADRALRGEPGADRLPQERGGARGGRAPARPARRCRHRRAARRPRRAAGGAVLRHGSRRHPAPGGALRARAGRGQRRVQGPARRQAARAAPAWGGGVPEAGMRGLLAFVFLVISLQGVAGNQRYEPLADSVRQRLTRMVSDRAPASLNFRSARDGQRWLEAMDQRLARRMPDRQSRLELLRAVHYEALRARLDPQLVLGLIEVESGFRKYAVSRSGARGYMQVMPFWVPLLGQPGHNLFHLRTNLAYGCAILRHYLDMERGDYFRALGRYNGTLGMPEYPNLVLTAWKGRWKYDGPTA